MTARRSGLVLGKFLPPHRGHQYLLDFARTYVEDLTVLVCSLPTEPIPGTLRARWVAEMCPGATVLHVPDDNPSEPADQPEAFWSIWIDTVRRRLPTGPYVVFTSERYGDELAHRLGAEHVIVDPDRELVPVSGTRIRQDPQAHWEYLPECVRSYFTRRIVITGPESTGKTTLCRALAKHFGTVWVHEWARPYLDFVARPPVPEDFPRVARAQRAAEAGMARQANRLLFLDTDPLVTQVYAELYLGSCPPEVLALGRAGDYALTLLTAPDVPWVPDLQRDFPERREEIFERIRTLLEEAGRPYTVLRGDWSARWQSAVAAVEALR